MRTYVIGYDLHKPQQDYEGLSEAIKALGSWWHCLDSTWMITTDETPAQIRDRLSPHIDDDDRLLVSAVGAPAAWKGFSQQCSDWLKENLN